MTMGFFGMLFWIVVVWMVIRAWHRRSERCLAVAPRGYAPELALRTRPDAGRQDYIDALESRLSELEERLDFTERLLASRGEK
jgi:hypothetical protein